MKKKRKIVIAVSLCFITLFTIGILVSAYFIDQENKDNNVKIGNNTHEISEVFEPPKEQKERDNSYKKQVSVVNTGNVPCYIRVYADFSDSAVRSRSSFSNDGTNFYSAERDLTNNNTYVSHLSEVAPNWVFIPDNDLDKKMAGYYYYTVPVAAGESTKPLFTYVQTYNKNNDEIQQYDIIVYSESYQTTDSYGEEYTSYQEVWRDCSSGNS